MSEETTPAAAERELQARFDEQAGDLGLAAETGRVPASEVRLVGIAAAAVHSVLAVERKLPPRPADDADRTEIAQVIGDFESIHPDELLLHWKRYATNPYVAVGNTQVALVREDGFAAFLAGDAFKETLKLFPPFKPRKLEVSRPEIVFLSPVRASATYTCKEEFRNGRVKVNNCTAILLKLDTGWKVTVVTTRDEGEGR
jgi:hypothetical protein